MEYTGEIISESTARRRLELNEGKPTYACEIVKGWVLDGRRMGSQALFINSSDDPNSVLETWWVGQTPHVVVCTLWAIRRGEEITVEYTFLLENREPCLCGSDRCSGWIGKRKKGERALTDPSVSDEPVPVLQPNFSRSVRATLRQYELIGEKVLGNSNCLFQSAAVLLPSRTQREWRDAIADDMEMITDAGTRAEYLLLANNDVRDGSPPLSSFEDLLRGIRGN
eukprot:1531681-Rhodomonas_salina.1